MFFDLILVVLYTISFCAAVICFVLEEIFQAKTRFTIVVDGVFFRNVQVDFPFIGNELKIFPENGDFICIRYHDYHIMDKWKVKKNGKI